MNKILNKYDFMLIIITLLLAVLSSFFFIYNKSSGNIVEILVDGKLYGEYSLYEDQEIIIDDGDCYNVIEIKNGKVSMREANCKDKYCINQGEITNTGGTIVCLPNRVVIQIEQSEEIDTVIS